MIQFFSPDIEESLKLPETESGHCVRVLRMKEGDKILVTDGKGHRFNCVIEDSNPKCTRISIIEKIEIPKPRNYYLVLAVAPTKNSDRLEWLLEKAVEIGIDKIVLLRCERSERKIQKSDRLQKIMVSAMKQSLDCRLPLLEEIRPMKDFVCECRQDAQKFFGYCDSKFPRKDFVKEVKPGGEIIVMIGPEGDFTTTEVDMAVSNNFIPVTFGEKRLRTETAGVYAVSAVNVINSLYN